MRGAFLLLPILALIPDTQAAFCYNYADDGGTKNCAPKNQLERYGSEWCAANWNISNGKWTSYDSDTKYARIGKVSNFNNRQECEVAFEDIIEDCHDAWVGGTSVSRGAALLIDFCQWSSASDFDVEEAEEDPKKEEAKEESDGLISEELR